MNFPHVADRQRLSERRRFIVGSERALNVLEVLREVEDEGALIVDDAIEPGERLNRRETPQCLLDVHRTQLELIKSGLILIRNDKQSVVIGVEFFGGEIVAEAV